jgi:hypothetical protein
VFERMPSGRFDLLSSQPDRSGAAQWLSESVAGFDAAVLVRLAATLKA